MNPKAIGWVVAVMMVAFGAKAAADERAALSGAWVADLSTEPGAVYTQPMNLTLGADGTVTRDFYNSAIEAGRWDDDRGRLCVSFRTTDGVGPYHTAARLADGGVVAGQTWAERRNFLFNWNATCTP
jgi:hypothetical protein